MSEFEQEREAVYVAWESVPRLAFRRVIPDSKETLLEFIEEPLKEAVGLLYDKNVTTFGSSCNLYDYSQGYAWISLEWATLSPYNRDVVTQYQYHELTTIDTTDIRIAGLFFPITENDYPDEVGQRATALAELFEAQPKNEQA